MVVSLGPPLRLVSQPCSPVVISLCAGGIPNSYSAELVGVLLGSHFSADCQKILLDCKGDISSAESTKRPVRQAAWVLRVQKSL